MPDQMSLAGILNDEKPTPPAEASTEAPPPSEAPESKPEVKEPVERPQSRKKAWQDKEQEAQGRVRDPATGQFAPKAQAEPEAPKKDQAAAAPKEPEKPAAPLATPPAQQQDLTDKEKAFLRGLQEERGKRQELERRLAAMEGGKAPGAPGEPKKGFWDDPEGMLAKHRQEVEQVGVNTRLSTAEMIARSRYPDFDEKLQVFQQDLMAAGPNQGALAAQWLGSPDPAQFVYTYGKNKLEMQQVGNLDALRAKIEKDTEARVRAKVEAEFKEKNEALERARAALPGSLSDARSSGVNKPVWGGPTPLEDVLK